MSFTKTQITAKGEAALIGAASGGSVTFTKVRIGNGSKPDDVYHMEGLSNGLYDCPLTGISPGENYVELSFSFDNSAVETGFQWREMGVFARDYTGEEILFCYSNAGDECEYIPSPDDSYSLESEYKVKIFMSSVENISAEIKSLVYVSVGEFQKHLEDADNPHKVTKDQIGLGNVENKHINAQEPTYTVQTALLRLISGETLSIAMGKIAKAILVLIDHIEDKVAHITKDERETWNGKADSKHDHAASDITSGTLSIERGGTGVTSYEALAKKLTQHISTAPFSVGSSAPSNTSIFWIDTTATTGGLKYYNGSSWVHVPVDYT